MSNPEYVSLRERALRAWEEERPNRVARLMKRAHQMRELSTKLKEVLGSDLPIRVVIDIKDRPVAEIENFRFALTTIGEENQKRLLLIEPCPRCGTETALLIDILADLGQLFDRCGDTLYLGCSECVALTNEDIDASAFPTGRGQTPNE